MVMDSRLRGNDRWGISNAEQGMMNVEVRFFAEFILERSEGLRMTRRVNKLNYGN